MCREHHIDYVKSVGDAGFSPGVCTNSQNWYYFSNYLMYFFLGVIFPHKQIYNISMSREHNINLE